MTAIKSGAYAHSNPDNSVMTNVKNPSNVSQQNVLNLFERKNFFKNANIFVIFLLICNFS